MYLLGLDVGTTTVKSYIYAIDGTEIASAKREYALYHPFVGASEMDPNENWSKIVEAIKESVNKLKDKSQLKALSISALGHAIMPLDETGEPLYNALQFYDNRAEVLGKKLQEKIGVERLARITGFPFIQNPLANILWFKKEKPEIYKKAAKFVGWHEYVLLKLCGEPIVDYSLASCYSLFDIKKGTWSSEIIEEAEIDASKLPKIAIAGTPVGTVTHDASEKTGLPKDMIVVCGAHDCEVSALGSGAVESGLLMDLTGTFELLYVPLSNELASKLANESIGMITKLCGKINRTKDIPVIGGGIATGGSVVKWFKDNFCHYEIQEAEKMNVDVYDLMMDLASKSNPGADNLFLLPDLMGWSPEGIKGTLLGLSLSHSKKHILRAILEGVTMEIRRQIEEIMEKGVPINEIRAVGGGAKSSFWLQLKADIIGKKVVRPKVVECGTLGAAILAGIGIGIYEDVFDGVKQTVKVEKEYMPREEFQKFYENYYRVYKNIRAEILKIYKEMNKIKPFLKV
jgi:xylulokinase